MLDEIKHDVNTLTIAEVIVGRSDCSDFTGRQGLCKCVSQ